MKKKDFLSQLEEETIEYKKKWMQLFIQLKKVNVEGT